MKRVSSLFQKYTNRINILYNVEAKEHDYKKRVKSVELRNKSEGFSRIKKLVKIPWSHCEGTV